MEPRRDFMEIQLRKLRDDDFVAQIVVNPIIDGGSIIRQRWSTDAVEVFREQAEYFLPRLKKFAAFPPKEVNMLQRKSPFCLDLILVFPTYDGVYCKIMFDVSFQYRKSTFQKGIEIDLISLITAFEKIIEFAVY